MKTPSWALERINQAKINNQKHLFLDSPPRFNEALTALPDELFEITGLEGLHLGNNGILTLPERITDLSNLRFLDLSRNELITIPNSISNLKRLESLDLSRNEISNIPESFVNLHNLKSLYLYKNNLHHFPAIISLLENLELLFIWGNQIRVIPESISRLSSLVKLDLSHNLLASLPKSISNLKHLKSLNLNGNRFLNVPESIFSLEELSSLSLIDNKLTDLPNDVIKLNRLVTLELEGNPIVTPPPEVAKRGVKAIQEYFRQILNVGEDYLYEAKFLILGEGGAGKTSLAQKIKNPDYELKDEKSTEGVDVVQWSFPIDKDRLFHVNIWDFGGQEIYHATHQFFLTKRSLYALVADTRKEDTDFYYWLNVVELLSDNSPLLIVKNEKQDRHREINERQLHGQFENLKEVLSTNLATNRGLEKVKEEIKHYIKNLPHVGSPLPKTWINVREILERDVRNYISLDEYLTICRSTGFTKTKDSLQLSGYLHDIGVFLHFQDDALLKNTVILKPKWGTNAVYKVLDNKDVIRNLGRFSRSDLLTIWGASEYTNMHDELLQLMMKFRLCYQIPDADNNYIAPQLLTENQPDFKINTDDDLLIRYTYEFMPKGILTQFIVAMHRFILEQKYVWRSGVILEKDKTLAEVIEHHGKREVHVRIVGAHKKALMSIVMYELDKIHRTYKRLRYDKMIPCNCTDCKTRNEPYFYRFDRLQKFLEDRQDQIQCQQSYKMVNVRSLIDDVLEKDFANKPPESPIAQYIIHGDYIDQGDKKMANNKISINNSEVYGSVIAADSIRESFNKINKSNIEDSLKEQLKQLSQAVEKMLQNLPKDKAEEVADDMKILADQATKEKPNPRWYKVSIDGLIKAAENLGKVGEPVIELSQKVLSLLIVGG